MVTVGLLQIKSTINKVPLFEKLSYDVIVYKYNVRCLGTLKKIMHRISFTEGHNL